jgi:hypothetical protein
MIIPNKHNGYARDGVRRVFFGGGDQPANTTQKVTQDLPDWAKPYAKESLGKASALADSPYQTYGGERIAQFSPLQQGAFGRAEGQQVAGQVGFGSGLAGLAGTSSFSDPNAAASFMSPYMQQVVDQQMASAQRQADIAATQRGAQAVRAGAFGGSRQAIENAEANRALASQKGQIQAQGLQSAFEQAQGQFNAEQATRLNAAQALGQLGQQQFGQEMGITGQQAEFGAQQRAATQDILSAQYQDFLNQQRAPYDQLAFMTSMIRGTPMGGTTTMYQPGPSPTSQMIGLGTAAAGAYGAYQGGQNTGTPGVPGRAAGGEVKSYAAGGIASLNQPEIAAMAGRMSDQQLGQTAQMPSITDLAKMTLKAEADQRAQMRQAAMQQQAMMAQQPQMTVAEEQMAAIDAMDQGLGGLEVPDDMISDEGMAGGGIVAFANGDEIPDPYDMRLRRGPVIAGVTDQPPAPVPAPLVEEKPPAPPGGPNYSGIMGLFDQERVRQMAAQEELGRLRAADMAADRDALAEEEKRAVEYGAEREKRLKGQEEKLAGSEKQNFNMTLIDIGLAMMAGQSPDALQNIAAGAQQGLKGYQSRLQNIQDSREKLDESMARLAEIREEKLSAVGARKRDLTSMERKELTNSKDAQERIYSSFADKKITLTKEQAKEASDRALTVWSAQQKANLGSKGDATQLRIALGTEIKALRDQRDKGAGLNEAETAQLMQLESEFRNLTNFLAGRVGAGGGGGGTLSAEDQALINKYR